VKVTKDTKVYITLMLED